VRDVKKSFYEARPRGDVVPVRSRRREPAALANART